MTTLKPQPVSYRRKREYKTNYHKRLKLLTSKKPRVVVRFSNQKLIGQVVEFSPKGDIVKVAVSSDFLKKQGWKFSLKNIPAVYLTGYNLGKKTRSFGIKEAILDTGFKQPLKKGKIYAFLKGILDAGVNVPHDSKEEIFPSNEKIAGQNLKNEVKEVFTAIKRTLSGN